jgi:hypothetical protein
MMAFCRQRAQFENEDASFWIEEAKEWDNWIARYVATVPYVYEETANDRPESRRYARARGPGDPSRVPLCGIDSH